jgi:integrase
MAPGGESPGASPFRSWDRLGPDTCGRSHSVPTMCTLMHLEQLPSGSWRAVVKHQGRRRSVTRRTKNEARVAGADLLSSIGGGPVNEQPTVGELLDGHLAVKATEWSPTFLADMRSIHARIPDEFLERRVAKVTPAIVTALYRQLAAAGWTPHRVRRVHELLSPAWRDAILFGWATANPCRDVRRPRIDQPDVSPPDDAQVRALLAAMSGTLEVAVRLAVATGCRRGEVVAFRWDTVDLDDGELLVHRSLAYTPTSGVVEGPTKTGRRAHRVLALDDTTVEILRRQRAVHVEQALANGLPAPEWVVSSDAGVTPWRPDRLTREYGKVRTRLGLAGIRFHDLRHYVATTMLQDGVPLIDVAFQLGHTSIATTTDRYGHFMPGRGRDAAERRARRFG